MVVLRASTATLHGRRTASAPNDGNYTHHMRSCLNMNTEMYQYLLMKNTEVQFRVQYIHLFTQQSSHTHFSSVTDALQFVTTL